jgi:hypothetical protein
MNVYLVNVTELTDIAGVHRINLVLEMAASAKTRLILRFGLCRISRIYGKSSQM